MRKTLLTLLTIVVGAFMLSAQQTKIVLSVKEGATKADFKAQSNNGMTINVNWGDGKIDTYEGGFLFLSHTYEKPTTRGMQIEILGDEIQQFDLGFNDNACNGVYDIASPTLESFTWNKYSNCTLGNSKDGKLDFSRCTSLQKISVKNPPKTIVFPQSKSISSLRISSDFDKTLDTYSQLSMPILDLTRMENLKEVDIMFQDIKEIDVTSLTQATKISLASLEAINIVGLQDVVNAKVLTDLNISGNKLSIEKLPFKNPDVTYSNFKINQKGFSVPAASITNNQLDLSYMANLTAPDGTVYETEFSFVEENKYSNIDPTMYTESNGVFTFKDEFFGEQETKSIQVKVQNKAFPNQELTGSSILEFKSDPITITKQQEAPVSYSMHITTTKEVGEEITMTINADGEIFTKGITFVSGDEYESTYRIDNQQIEIGGEGIFEFAARDCGISSIVFDEMPDLSYVILSHNNLSSIDLSKLPNLGNLDISHNQITALDLSQNTGLYMLSINNNNIGDSEMTALIESLVDWTEWEYSAMLIAVNLTSETEKNFITGKNVGKANARSWKVYTTNDMGELAELASDVQNTCVLTYASSPNITEKELSVKVDDIRIVSGTEVEIGKTVYFVLDNQTENGEIRYTDIKWSVDGEVVASDVTEFSIVMEKDTNVSVTANNTAFNCILTYTFSDDIKKEDLSVKVDNVAIESGAKVQVGKVVNFVLDNQTEKGNPRYTDIKWSVNGEAIENNSNEYSFVIEQNTTIAITATPLGNVNIDVDNTRFVVKGKMLIIKDHNPEKLVQVFDTKGMLILQSRENRIDLSSLPNGTYIVKVDDVVAKIAF